MLDGAFSIIAGLALVKFRFGRSGFMNWQECLLGPPMSGVVLLARVAGGHVHQGLEVRLDGACYWNSSISFILLLQSWFFSGSESESEIDGSIIGLPDAPASPAAEISDVLKSVLQFGHSIVRKVRFPGRADPSVYHGVIRVTLAGVFGGLSSVQPERSALVDRSFGSAALAALLSFSVLSWRPEVRSMRTGLSEGTEDTGMGIALALVGDDCEETEQAAKQKSTE